MLLRSCPPSPASKAAFDPAAEANHRIANHLSLIAGMAWMRGKHLREEWRAMSATDVWIILQSYSSRLETIARLHHFLATGHFDGPIPIGDYLREIAESVVSSLSLAGTMQLSAAAGPACLVPADDAVALGLIVCELVTNAVRFAHPTGVSGTIRLASDKDPDGIFTLEVADDGVGLPEELDPMTDGMMGFSLVRSLAAQLGAAVAYESSPLGLQFQLQMRVA